MERSKLVLCLVLNRRLDFLITSQVPEVARGTAPQSNTSEYNEKEEEAPRAEEINCVEKDLTAN